MATQPDTSAKVIAFPTPPRRLRADVVPFDPTNPAHQRAWENLWDYGQLMLRHAAEGRGEVR